MVYDRALYWQWVGAAMTDAVFGSQNRFTQSADYNAIRFMFEQLLNQKHTMTLVKVVSCTGTDSPESMGAVDVQPLVMQLNGSNEASAHGQLFSLPYIRLQGGGNGIVIDPKPGDIGMAVFADRDISKVIANKDQSPPGSRRVMSFSDGVYLGGILNGELSQYIRFFDGGIELVAAIMTAVGSMLVSGNLSVSTGATGSFTTPTGSVVTVVNGIVMNIT